MKKLFNILVYSISILLFFSPTIAQEKLIGLKINPIIKKHVNEKGYFNNKYSSSTDTLSLPFFEDFSNYSIFPADSLWEDNFAFINNGFSIFPPTNGVATLDAINETGSLYSNASSSPFIADYLTSLPIDLDGYSYSDSIFLSFFYQPQGVADAPEETDSLIVEFYSPETDEWYWAWSRSGSQMAVFKAAIIQIPDTSIFYQKGFKFRFKNYTSLTGLFEPSWASNADQWHVDYIIMDLNRNNADTVIVDLAFLSQPGYLLNDYVSIPWKHFLLNNSQMTDTFDISFVNHRANSIIVNREIEIFDLIDGGAPYEVIGGGGASDNFSPGDTTIAHNISYSFTSTATDYAKFLVKAHIKPGEIVADFSANNDTATYIQIFDNYYAHDDGSAESGYGLSGEGTQNALLACKFHNYKLTDSLRAVDMYFNETLGGASQDYFYLQIWAHDEVTERPGELLYSKIGMRPEYEDSLFQFHRYYLKNELDIDTAIGVPSIFYVGWKQTTSDLLNIGFDKNRAINTDTIAFNNPWIFFNVSGGWQQSTLEGAIMMRPVFSQEALVSIEGPIEEDFISNIYPNPNNGIFNIDLSGQSNIEDVTYNVISTTGRLIKSGNINSNISSVNISDLPDGIYFIRIVSSRKHISNHKIILIH